MSISMFSRRSRRSSASAGPVPQPAADAAVTLPSTAATAAASRRSSRSRGGGMFAAVHSDLRGVDRVHGGSPDLVTYPPSIAEERLAFEWLTSGDPIVGHRLKEIACSEDRAVAVALDVRARRRRELDAEIYLRRTFGAEPATAVAP